MLIVVPSVALFVDLVLIVYCVTNALKSPEVRSLVMNALSVALGSHAKNGSAMMVNASTVTFRRSLVSALYVENFLLVL